MKRTITMWAAALAAGLYLGMPGVAQATETEPDPSPSVSSSSPAPEETTQPTTPPTTAPVTTPPVTTPVTTPTTNPTAEPSTSASPSACAAYFYTGTAQSLCTDFPGNVDRTCAQVGYQVTLKNTAVDPWDLDGISGGDRGVVGLGCESKPRKPVSPSNSASTSATPGEDQGGLPVTGPSIGLLVLLAAGVIGLGVVLTIAVRRRKVDFSA